MLSKLESRFSIAAAAAISVALVVWIIGRIHISTVEPPSEGSSLDGAADEYPVSGGWESLVASRDAQANDIGEVLWEASVAFSRIDDESAAMGLGGAGGVPWAKVGNKFGAGDREHVRRARAPFTGFVDVLATASRGIGIAPRLSMQRGETDRPLLLTWVSAIEWMFTECDPLDFIGVPDSLLEVCLKWKPVTRSEFRQRLGLQRAAVSGLRAIVGAWDVGVDEARRGAITRWTQRLLALETQVLPMWRRVLRSRLVFLRWAASDVEGQRPGQGDRASLSRQLEAVESELEACSDWDSVRRMRLAKLAELEAVPDQSSLEIDDAQELLTAGAIIRIGRIVVARALSDRGSLDLPSEFSVDPASGGRFKYVDGHIRAHILLAPRKEGWRERLDPDDERLLDAELR